MKTLTEHIAQRMEHYEAIRKMQEPHPNRIYCPRCGAEPEQYAELRKRLEEKNKIIKELAEQLIDIID